MTQVKAVKIEILSAEAEIKYCKSLPKIFEVTNDPAEPDIMWWRANREIKENICTQPRESKVDLRVTMADGAKFEFTMIVNSEQREIPRLVGKYILNNFNFHTGAYQFDGYDPIAIKFKGWRFENASL